MVISSWSAEREAVAVKSGSAHDPALEKLLREALAANPQLAAEYQRPDDPLQLCVPVVFTGHCDFTNRRLADAQENEP